MLQKFFYIQYHVEFLIDCVAPMLPLQIKDASTPRVDSKKPETCELAETLSREAEGILSPS